MALRDGLFALWIIDEGSGICLFQQEFKELPQKINEDLIGGFFSAMRQFSREVTGQSIQSIQLDEIRLFFQEMDKIFLVLATTHHVERIGVQKFLVNIEDRFDFQYGETIDEGMINKVDEFDDFAEEVEIIIGKKSKHSNIFDDGGEIIAQRYQEAKENLNLLRKKLLNGASDIIERSFNKPLEKIGKMGVDLLKSVGISRKKRKRDKK